MNKKEFIETLSKKTGLNKKESANALNSTLEIITEALVKGESVNFVGFGKFSVHNRAERMGRNPQTGESMKIPATKTPTFKAGKSFKEMLN